MKTRSGLRFKQSFTKRKKDNCQILDAAVTFDRKNEFEGEGNIENMEQKITVIVKHIKDSGPHSY